MGGSIKGELTKNQEPRTKNDNSMFTFSIQIKDLNTDWYDGSKTEHQDTRVLNLRLYVREKDDYRNDIMVVQSVPKAVRDKDANIRGKILGNGRFVRGAVDVPPIGTTINIRILIHRAVKESLIYSSKTGSKSILQCFVKLATDGGPAKYLVHQQSSDEAALNIMGALIGSGTEWQPEQQPQQSQQSQQSRPQQLPPPPTDDDNVPF